MGMIPQILTMISSEGARSEVVMIFFQIDPYINPYKTI